MALLIRNYYNALTVQEMVLENHSYCSALVAQMRELLNYSYFGGAKGVPEMVLESHNSGLVVKVLV